MTGPDFIDQDFPTPAQDRWDTVKDWLNFLAFMGIVVVLVVVCLGGLIAMIYYVAKWTVA